MGPCIGCPPPHGRRRRAGQRRLLQHRLGLPLCARASVGARAGRGAARVDGGAAGAAGHRDLQHGHARLRSPVGGRAPLPRRGASRRAGTRRAGVLDGDQPLRPGLAVEVVLVVVLEHFRSRFVAQRFLLQRRHQCLRPRPAMGLFIGLVRAHGPRVCDGRATRCCKFWGCPDSLRALKQVAACRRAHGRLALEPRVATGREGAGAGRRRARCRRERLRARSSVGCSAALVG
mmetsp:Transcript_14987/g.52595  ORF Transcript_14987/g.52595 Transcript_14987/m.52595 type:complete len:232 (-) Transcript_14987:496-1191(-)